MQRGGVTYIISNKTRTTFYTGVTSNLLFRIIKHRNGEGSAFTKRYKIKYLMHYEFYPRIEEAIAREKQLKRWHREWKINLIKLNNPNLEDLYERLLEEDKSRGLTRAKSSGEPQPRVSRRGESSKGSVDPETRRDPETSSG